MRPADDPAWGQYPETVLEFFRDPEDDGPALRVDLRRPVDGAVRARLAELGLDGPFGVVTAAAPRGQPQAEDFDDARQAELDEVARTDALAHTVRVDGVSPDGAHRERSVAVRLPKDEVVALGRRYQQSAVFWFDGDGFWLLGALVAAEPRRLPA
jgi:hypothetical protein